MAEAKWSDDYSVLKATEGGTPQWVVRQHAEKLGVEVRFFRSPYIGHYGVGIKTRNKRTLARFERLIFGGTCS